ncbi:uncharacterized protein LOC109847466 [Asparagus officinalis]|uniref:uncharacterized protein LOC109847466 n=1 Tax=Asparagus officinalis TaxID=4686 RepID=UPI00098E49D0|nr:uncharacterized protein LOC109847466 [Asparagus officinalis]
MGLTCLRKFVYMPEVLLMWLSIMEATVSTALGDAHASTSGGGDATHDSQPQDTSCGDAPHDVEIQADPTQHAEIPPPPHADILEERRFEPYSVALEAAALPPDSIPDQRAHGPANVRDDWDSYHDMRPIALQRYEQAKRRCLELKGTEKPPRRGRNATKESSLIPDLNRRAVIRWENGVPVGAFANAFNNFLAVLARRHDFFNIFLTWKSQRIDALVACWRYICRFFFLDDNICAWTYCFGQINVSFKRWRFEVKKKYFVQITEDWERYWHLDTRVDGVDFFALCSYWDTAEIQAQAEIARRNRNAPRNYEHHGDCHFDESHFPTLGGGKDQPKKEITWTISLDFLDPRTKEYELKVQRIIHLQKIANQLSDAFSDSRRITKSYIPAENAPIKIDIPERQIKSANESKARLKREVTLEEPTPEENKTSINFVITRKSWNRREVIVDNAFAYNIALDIMEDDEDHEPRSVDEYQ